MKLDVTMVRILDKVDFPGNLKALTEKELIQLADEIREEMVKVISINGGHLASSLGTVELTIALHRIFDSPRDKIIWDVGHQSYAHKMLTGRKERFSTIRQYGGISGFPVRAESPHDAFGAGHSGNSVSAAVGIALARNINRDNYQVIAVIGDGSLGEGMAFEAINHAGHLGTKLIVILNDNGMSISPSVGALSKLFNQVRLDTRYADAKKKVGKAIRHMPFGKTAWEVSNKMKQRVERVLLPNAFWEEMGFTYLGPLDGHNIKEMEAALIRARDLDTRPTVIHILTKKGKGYPQAETDVVAYHGITPNGLVTNGAPSYSQVFGRTISRLMLQNEKIVAISAAMLEGTGLAKVAAEFPNRVFDVGICEQHAVTMAAGLATQGLIPIVAVYSTFLQRAYDQIIHDVCAQNLPVIFAVDRAGIVGEDGMTHQGSFDISYMRVIPNMVLAAPANEDELQHLLFSAISYQQPVAIRYPRGNGQGVTLAKAFQNLPLGKGEVTREGKELTILAMGSTVCSALEAAEMLAMQGTECAVINARFAKPLDSELVLSQAVKTRNLLTVEENVLNGGFGSAVMELLSATSVPGVKVKCLGLPDKFIEHGPRELFRSLFNLDAEGIALSIRSFFPELFNESRKKQERKNIISGPSPV
jgi:1-deoxy-D-xylulose-5-phosphate synthase